MIDTEDIYPEGVCPEQGSSEIGIEINANMVETFDGWISKEQTVRKEQTVERELQLVRKNWWQQEMTDRDHQSILI